MPKMSKSTAKRVTEVPTFQEYADQVDDYTVSLVSLQEDSDLAPLLAGLPNDQCPCTHWGYMFKGTQTATYSDHEETYEAGEAFVMTPGHTARATAGSEFLVFSLTDEFAPVEAHMVSKMQAMHS